MYKCPLLLLSQGCCHLLGSCCFLAQKSSVVVRPFGFDMCRLHRDRFYVGVWPLIEESLIPKDSVLVNQRTSSYHCPKTPWAFPTWQKILLEVLLIISPSLIQRPLAWIACGLDDAFPPRAAAGQSWTSLQSLVSCITIDPCHTNNAEESGLAFSCYILPTTNFQNVQVQELTQVRPLAEQRNMPSVCKNSKVMERKLWRR